MKAAEQLCVEASLLAWNLIVGSCRLTLASHFHDRTPSPTISHLYPHSVHHAFRCCLVRSPYQMTVIHIGVYVLHFLFCRLLYWRLLNHSILFQCKLLI